MSVPSAGEYWKEVVTVVETLQTIDAWEVVDHAEDVNILEINLGIQAETFS